MTSFEWYYDFVIRSRILQPHLSTTENEIFNNISKILRSWGGDSIVDIKLSGSRAKGTATNLSSDMDIFVSLSKEALQKPLFPSRNEQNRSVRFFFTTSKNGVFFAIKIV